MNTQEITLNDIDIYLDDVKNSLYEGRYRIEMNSRRRQNRELFLTYIIDESMARDILLGLTRMDFSEILRNEHQGYEHELLYVFGKDVELIERISGNMKTVPLYIKFNKLEDSYVIVISLHEQKYPITYYFK